MNRIYSYFVLLGFVLLAGCSSEAVFTGKPKTVKDAEVLSLRKGLSPVSGESIWIIEEGLKGEAGLYNDQIALPIKSLDIDINIVEFLASVDVSLSYSKLKAANNLSFRYPAYHGMLVKDFQVKIGPKKFRAVIVKKEAAKEIYDLARKQSFNAFLVSQKVFGNMIVNTSIREQSDVDILFSYTQLSSVSKKTRLLAIPEFKNLDEAEFNLDVRGNFISPVQHLSGLNKEIKANKFFVNSRDKGLLKGGLIIKYELEELASVTADKKKAVTWNAQSSTYQLTSTDKVKRFNICSEDAVKPVFSYLTMLNLLKKGKSFKELQDFAIQSKLLTPLTSLLLVDTSG